MTSTESSEAQRLVFRTLNRVVEPIVRHGSARIWIAGCPQPVSATGVRLPRGALAVFHPTTPHHPPRRSP